MIYVNVYLKMSITSLYEMSTRDGRWFKVFIGAMYSR